jgi:hypothetical protein
MKSQASFQMRICSREVFGANWLTLRWMVGLKNLNYGIADPFLGFKKTSGRLLYSKSITIRYKLFYWSLDFCPMSRAGPVILLLYQSIDKCDPRLCCFMEQLYGTLFHTEPYLQKQWIVTTRREASPNPHSRYSRQPAF